MLDAMPDGVVASPERAPVRVVGPSRPFSRAKAVRPGWTLGRHLLRTLAIAAGIAALGGGLAVGAAWWAWACVPAFWLVANVFEWAMHRYLMHRPLWPRVLYDTHARMHHRAFDGREQEVHGVHELSLVMMPWFTLLFVFAASSPIALAAGLMGGRPLAGVFLLSAVSYFLFYEAVHTVHHLPEAVLRRSWWGRRRALACMRRAHHHHHHLERMAEVNFNVTFAFADRLLGTYQAPSGAP